MNTEMGEYIVGAYLKIIKECGVVDYNVRLPGGGKEGQFELDVIGLDFENSTAYLCEVTTHIRGLLYVTNVETIERIEKKHDRQKIYAEKQLATFDRKVYMFWSPYVPKGILTEGLALNEDLELVINDDYTERINELRARAKEMTNDAGNPAFRLLQILEHLR